MPFKSEAMEDAARKVRKSKDLPGQVRASVVQTKLQLGTLAGAAPQEAQPFLKWAGGKSQLLAQLDQFFPESFDRFVEPFVGGGAVFFHLRSFFPEVPSCLCDNNDELINCYRIVRDRPDELMCLLDDHLAKFKADRKIYYYEVREQRLREPLQRAARMVFLNKTCFNGLWRVNSRGEFNVPMGSATGISFYDRTNLLTASRALRGVDLVAQDFRKTLAETRPGDFVYIDPPYDPTSKTSSFTSYTKDAFGSDEQNELAHLFHDAARRGVGLMLSNSDTPLIRRLYRGFRMRSVQARRMINSKGKGRGAVSEVVVLSASKEQDARGLGSTIRSNNMKPRSHHEFDRRSPKKSV